MVFSKGPRQQRTRNCHRQTEPTIIGRRRERLNRGSVSAGRAGRPPRIADILSAVLILVQDPDYITPCAIRNFRDSNPAIALRLKQLAMR